MAVNYTEEQLNSFSKETVIQLFLSQQVQLDEIDRKLVLEQVAVLNRHRFGRSQERLNIAEQISFLEINGEIVLFNEAEALASLEEEEEEPQKERPKKNKGKRAADLSSLPTVVIEHEMSEEELDTTFGEGGYKRLPNEVYRCYRFTPARVEVEEHHVAVYAAKDSSQMAKAAHPPYLLRNSLVSPSLEAAILNGKYVNAVPLARLEKEFERYGLAITRQNMANWTIQCAERYLALLYDYLHERLYQYCVIQADETPVIVRKDGRPAGAKSYMWVYRTGQMYADCPVVLYDYQMTRKTDHPRHFLKDFKGVCVTDGYQVYHTLDAEREDLVIAGCWAHARRRYDEARKAMPKKQHCISGT